MKDSNFFRGIRGPVGSGKSVACCVEVFRRSLEQKKNDQGIRKSRWAIIRNTNPQLRTTTIKNNATTMAKNIRTTTHTTYQ